MYCNVSVVYLQQQSKFNKNLQKVLFFAITQSSCVVHIKTLYFTEKCVNFKNIVSKLFNEMFEPININSTKSR